MTFSDFNSHTNQLFIDLKILKVRNIIDLQQLQLVYDFYDNRLPKDLKNLFTFSSDIHTTNFKLKSAYKNLIHIPGIKTVNYGNKSINFHCAELWNDKLKNGISIDDDVSHNVAVSKIHNRYKFKRILQKHFLHSYNIVES